MMDLAATNANGCPMDFDRLLMVESFTFVHDITGIARHLDRSTGELGDFFLPRRSKKERRPGDPPQMWDRIEQQQKSA